MILRLLAASLLPLVMGLVLFTSAGRLSVPAFWAYILVMWLILLPAAVLVHDPGLAKERWTPGPGGVDGGLCRFAAPLVLVHLVIAGLDVGRYGWSMPPTATLQVSALIVAGAGVALVMWSMAVNTFFSPVVRIQSDRGHVVVTSGPYRFVRHPGYLGMTLALSVSGIALGSWWSMLPATGYVALVLRRTAIEDRFLLEKLPGYRDYARRVTRRVLPGVW